MEKFFIVTEKSSLHKAYFEWKENRKQINEVAKQFMNEHGIETTRYHCTSKEFYIVPTKSDLEKFSEQFTTKGNDILHQFKQLSVIGKAWKAKKLSIIKKPCVPMWFKSCGKNSWSILDIDGTIYLDFQNEYETMDTPIDFIEIKGSEYHKIIEDWEEKQ